MQVPNMLEAKKRNNSKPINYEYKDVSLDESLIGKKYYVRTYGCQMNVHDGERVKGVLTKNKMVETDNIEEASIVILNTCAIRENAHDKVFGFLGLVKKLKENHDILLGICGCMAQEESVVNEIREKHPYIDIVFGTHNMNDLPKMLTNYYGKQDIEVYSKEGDVIEFGNLYKRDSNISAWVNIMYGCDKFCTYCIVPYTRGKQRSRKSEDIIKEVKELKEAGYKEITLLGQNVNAYGKDLDGEIEFSKLLEKVSDIGIERIRFVTSHPWDFTDKMIDVIASRENIMPYIHLPLQSGSNKILKLMGRRYTKEEYLELFNKIRNKVKNASITTDIIVAFPGETEEDFNDTLDVVNTCKYDGAFTFIYSPRENTPAAKMKNDLTEAEKEDRLHRLNELVNKYSKESNERMLNTIQKVLVIGVSEKDSNKVCGYTENMKLVNVTAPMDTIGQIINVKITDAKSFSLDGEIIEN